MLYFLSIIIVIIIIIVAIAIDIEALNTDNRSVWLIWVMFQSFFENMRKTDLWDRSIIQYIMIQNRLTKKLSYQNTFCTKTVLGQKNPYSMMIIKLWIKFLW